MALKEVNSNEEPREPSSGGRPLQISLPSLTDLADRIYRRTYRCMRPTNSASSSPNPTLGRQAYCVGSLDPRTRRWECIDR